MDGNNGEADARQMRAADRVLGGADAMASIELSVRMTCMRKQSCDGTVAPGGDWRRILCWLCDNIK